MGTGCKIMQEEIFRYMENGGGKIVIHKERNEISTKINNKS